jgi:DNA-binding MarR family transcriptional regulator
VATGPPLSGLLRLVATQPGQSQQELAGQLRTPPSRLVLLVDQLEERGLIERRRNPDDRRHYALFLTAEGGQFLRIAEQQGLIPGVHPGYHPGYQQLSAP